MTRRLLAGYLGITLLVLLVHDVPLALSFGRDERERVVTALQRDAFLLGGRAEDHLEAAEPGPSPALDALLVAYSGAAGARVVLTDRDGIAVASSDPESAAGRDYSTRPEIGEALAGRTTDGNRRSTTLGMDLFFVAVPVVSGNTVVGTVRLTFPASAIDADVRARMLGLGGVAAISLALAAGAGFVLARSLDRPLRRLQSATDQLAAGDLTARVPTGEGPATIRSLAGAFNAMADQLGSLLRAQRSFAGDASHQLRTPLTALRLRLEQAGAELERGGVAEAQLAVDAATEEAHRLGRLVEGLLALSRAGAGTVRVEQVDAAALARDRVEMWAPLYDERGVALRASVPPQLAAYAVRGAVEQILDNYLANALEVAPAGSEVLLEALPTARGVELHVLDAGPGLDVAARARAFDRFWRAPDAPPGGSGLGLPIARALARAGGGEAELRAAPGGGLDAVVLLAVTPPPATVAPPPG